MSSAEADKSADAMTEAQPYNNNLTGIEVPFMKKKKVVVALGHKALGATLPQQQTAVK